MKATNLLLVILASFVTSVTTAQNCSVNAGVDQTVCTSSVTLTGAYSTSVATTWSQVSGPTATITSPSALVTTVTGLVGGNTYRFRISTVCGDGLPTSDEVTVIAQDFPTANAGSDFTLCTGTAALAAGALQSGETGLWTIVSGSGGLSFSNSSSATSNLTLATGTNNSGAAVLRWTVTKTASGCTASSDISVTKIAVNNNVTAGGDKTVTGCYNSVASAVMNASFSGGGTYGVWSVVSGPNTPTFSSINAYNATVNNLIEGVYILRWTVTSPCTGSVSDDVQITVASATGAVSPATAAIVGAPTMPFCDIPESITLSGSAYNPVTEYVTWSKTSGTATITSPNERYTSVTGFNGTTTVFRYSITNIATSCTVLSSNLTVSFEAGQTLSITTPSPMTLSCNATSATISISQSGSTTPQWSLVSGPVGFTAKSYSNISGSSFLVSNLNLPGTYIVRVKKTVGNCTTIYDDISIIVSKSPTASNAGSDPALACNATQTTLIGNAPTAGTGQWSQLSGPNTANIATKTNPQTVVSGLVSGVYEFRWTISNGPNCATTQDDVRVRVASGIPTSADAGSDQDICASTPLTLSGNFPDSNETGTWTVSPSSGVTFANRNYAKTTVTGLAANATYTFTWTIANNCSSSADNVIVTTSELVGPIAALAGADQCLSAGTTTVTLAGNSPSSGTGLWTKLAGGSATITNPALYNSTVTGLSNGTYTFEWSITRNACTITHDTVTVTISNPVTTANAGADQLSICGTSATMAANTATVGTGVWTQVGGAGGPVITNPLSPTTTITNLGEGQYTFRWTISNTGCTSSSDDVIVFASTPPTAPLAGVDKTVCGGTSVTMTANTITTGTGYWNIVSGPNAPTVTTAANLSPTASFTGLTTGQYRFTWNSSNGLCTTLSDEVIVNVIPAASAGANQTLCGSTSTTLNGNANTTGVWSQVSPSVTTEVITPTADNMAAVTGLIPGNVYIFKYTLLNADACAGSKEATTTVTVLDSPTGAMAGTDQDVCIETATTTITLDGNSPAVGIGTWTRITGTGSITTPSNRQTTVTNVSPGLSVFRWTVSNGACTNYDEVVISVSRVVFKSAGNDQSVCGTTATMAAEAASSGKGTWTKTSGPDGLVFASTISNNTAVTGLLPGTYVLRWTITDGSCTATYDEMTLTVNTAPTAPLAGADQTLCNSTSTSLEGNTILIGTGTWSKVSGPTCTITSPSSPTSTIIGMTPGTYVFRWTASNSCTDLSDEVTIVNNNPPTTANAGSDIRVCMYSAFNLNANAPSVGTGSWSQVSGPTIHFTDASLRTTTITGAIAGTYVFRWSISSTSCSASTDDVTLIIDESVTEPYAGEDINTTTASATMDANTITSGIGTWSKISGPIGSSITNVNLPTTTITGLVQGTYVYRWTAVNGTCSNYDEVTIVKSELQTYNINPSPTFTACTIGWSKGSMTSRVVFMKEGTGTIINPVNATTYTASSYWVSKGTQAGTSGYYCIYSGTGTSVYVTGLYPGRTYTVRAFEFNGSTGSEQYLTNLTGAANPTTFVPWPTTTFYNSNGVTTEESWETAARWDHDTIPTTALHEAVLVYIDGNCAVNSDASCYNLTIKAAHGAVTPKLTITTDNSLNVVGGALGGQFVNSGGVNGLLVKASATQPNGTLMWKTGNPTGTVEMYSKASWDLSKPVNNKYKWQFIGIPVKTMSYTTAFSNCYVREWDETVTRYEDVWARRNDGTSLQLGFNNTLLSTKGYELVQQYPKIYTFKGTLEHGDFEKTLSYTPTAYFKGQHVLGNPYTAAIDIRTIEFGANTESTVYQYNSGTYMDWIDNNGENVGIDGTELTPARYAVATKQTAGVLGILRQVPSMQAFLVKATNEAGGSIRIPYPNGMKNAIHQRAKQDPGADVVATRIDVKGKIFSDKMWIFVDPTCTSGFDDGWDGIKMPGDDAVTQIFGVETDGAEYQINAVNDINESVIGFKPGNDKDFTLKFTHQNMQLLYNKLFLLDMVDNKKIDITADGSLYTFSSKTGDLIKRFKIITEATSTMETKLDNNVDVFVQNGVVCINNRNEFSAKLSLYDEIGRCIHLMTAEANTQAELPVKLAKGVYLIRMNSKAGVLTKRIVMN